MRPGVELVSPFLKGIGCGCVIILRDGGDAELDHRSETMPSRSHEENPTQDIPLAIFCNGNADLLVCEEAPALSSSLS
jgi:hypothetical protein